MKFGFRKPNIKKSIKARTTGKIKRKAKKAINPFYGKKGMGYIKNPKKAIYNKIYNKTTFGISDIVNVAKPKKHTSPRVKNKREAEELASQHLKHCQESTNIINNTKVPHIFFERYHFLEEETMNLIELEKFIKFKGKTPTETLKHLSESKEQETNLMIGRAWEDLGEKLKKLKTNKAKINNIEKLAKEFEIYKEDMVPSNIELYKSYYDTFISNVE